LADTEEGILADTEEGILADTEEGILADTEEVEDTDISHSFCPTDTYYTFGNRRIGPFVR
jgi:hypothetical protein